jgi:AsmA protein
MTVDRINVNPYLAPGAQDDTVKAAKAKAAQPDAPIALGGLKAINANLTLAVGELLLPHITLNQAIIKASLNDGLLQADMTKVNAYGGTGSAALTVDAAGDTPRFHGTLDLASVNVQPLLVQMMDFKRLSGKGSVRYDIAASGATTKAIVKSMSGKGDLRLADGAITGADLGAVSRVIQSVVTANALGAVVGDNAKTTFGKMGASFTIAQGVLQTKDFQLVNSDVEMNGSGNVDFSGETLEFHFAPKAVKGIPGLKLVDIGVPFYVKGPWDKLSFGPDVRGLAKAVVEKLEDGASSPLDVLTRPGLSLKSILGVGKNKTQ